MALRPRIAPSLPFSDNNLYIFIFFGVVKFKKLISKMYFDDGEVERRRAYFLKPNWDVRINWF